MSVTSADPVFTVPARYARPERATARAAAGDRPWIRVITFAALALYGIERWATLLAPAPTWRLLGVFGLAVALAGAVPLVRRLHALPAGLVAAGLVLAAFPVSGLPWQWFVHHKIAHSANLIGTGLQALPNALVPYVGPGQAVSTVIVLGAAVLALDAAAVMAFAPRTFGDVRRAAAALPLIALAIVPCTLVRPEFPYLQGLLLFVLLAAFMWGERVRRDAVASAIAIAVVAGVAGAVLAPRIDQRSPWLNYRAWAGNLVRAHVDTFNWNQTYGPLHWPHTGHEVMTVSARTGDYWKAEDLDTFNGYAWVQGPPAVAPALPSPGSPARDRWSQTIKVSIVGMRTSDVIAAGYATPLPQSPIPGGFGEGSDLGTWVAVRELTPGSTYDITTYSPHPSPAKLTAAGDRYPVDALGDYLTLGIPAITGSAAGPSPIAQITFPVFHSAASPSMGDAGPNPAVAALVSASPYGQAYALARHLAATATTPYAYVKAVMRSMSTFAYNETPPVRRYPLASFLFTDRQGYCQQFSGATAMLLRMGGVPARVAAGFTTGTYDRSHRRWVVTDIDAHAWVEVWFPRYGWVRFDPTPVSAPARGGSAAPPILKTLGGLTGHASAAPRREIGSAAVTHRTTAHSGGGGVSAGEIAAGVAVVLLAGAMIAVRGGGDSPDALLAELERALSRTRRPLADGVTLAALERRFAASPEAAAYVRTLRMARYGGQATPPTATQRRALRHELRRGLGFAGRLRALWALPPRPRKRPPRLIQS